MNRTFCQKEMEMIKLTTAEFAERYYFHDSSIDKIEYDAENKKLTLTIDFCFWMQNWYEKGKPENGYIAVTFENVSLFEYEQHEFSNILENLDTEIDHIEIATDEMLEIYIWEYNSPTEKDNFWWIKIRAENITVEEL